MDPVQNTCKVRPIDHLPEQTSNIKDSYTQASHHQQQSDQSLSFDTSTLCKKIELNLGHHAAPQITHGEYLSLFQGVIPLSQPENVVTRNIEDGGNNLIHELNLFQKINQSLLPKRISNNILNKIKTFLKDNYDSPNASIAKIRLRNKSIIHGYILFSIYQLKFLQQVAFGQQEAFILNKKENQITEFSLAITESIERQIYSNSEKNNGKTQIQQFINLSNCFLEFYLKLSCQQVRTFFIYPFIQSPIKFINTSHEEKQLQRVSIKKYLKLTQFFEHYQIQKDKKNQQSNSSIQVQKFSFQTYQDQLFTEKKAKDTHDFENNFNQQTSGEQSNSIKSKQSVKNKESNQDNITYEMEKSALNQQQTKKQAQVVENQQNQHDVQARLPNDFVQEVQHVDQPNAENVQNVQNEAQLQILGSTMDSLNPANYDQPWDQQLQHFQPVAQNLQQYIHELHQQNNIFSDNILDNSSSKEKSDKKGPNTEEILLNHIEALEDHNFTEEKTSNCQSLSDNLTLKRLQANPSESETTN